MSNGKTATGYSSGYRGSQSYYAAPPAGGWKWGGGGGYSGWENWGVPNWAKGIQGLSRWGLWNPWKAYTGAYLSRSRGATTEGALEAGRKAGFGTYPAGGTQPAWQFGGYRQWGEKPGEKELSETYYGEFPPWLKWNLPPEWEEQAKTTTGEVVKEAQIAPLREQFPHLTDRVLTLLAGAEEEAAKHGGGIWTGTRFIPLEWLKENVFSNPEYPEARLRYWLGEQEQWRPTENPLEGGKITDPITGETTGWTVLTVPTTRTMRGINQETGEPWVMKVYPMGDLEAGYGQQQFYLSRGYSPGYAEWTLPQPPFGISEAYNKRGTHQWGEPETWAEKVAPLYGYPQIRPIHPQMTTEEEAKLYEEYGNLYDWYKEAQAVSGRYLTFEEWLKQTPEALALYQERQRKKMLPQPYKTARWRVPKQRV